MPFSLLLIPVFLIGAGISIPWTYVQRRVDRRREKRFAGQMQAANHSMTWQEFETVLEKHEGTVIGEYLSSKGPYRLWWTPDDIPALTPHKWDKDFDYPILVPEFVPFFNWCRERYTHPQSGAAQLVMVSDSKHLREKLAQARDVAICSFPGAQHDPGTKVVSKY